jgi:4'-phosphopantetheinyl transferase
MSLASHLLKHLIITKFASLSSWSESVISRDGHGKPCFLPAPEMDFNVSHQAGIVSLIAVVGLKKNGGKVEVGTDVVCVNERLVQDYAHIEKDGFFEWVDIHGDVFSDGEVSYMKLAPVPLALSGEITGFGKDAVSRCQWRNAKVGVKVQGQGEEGEKSVVVDSNDIIDAKLRRFYACWCLREAYIKMTGEALLAPWLKELEISDVKAPGASTLITDEASLKDGETESDFTIHFKGKRVTNAKMELVALGKEFMVGAAVRPAGKLEELGLRMGRWEWLDLERDVLAFAESRP